VICPRLYAVVDAEASARAGRAPLDVGTAFIDAGVSLVQVRGKRLGAAALLSLTRALVAHAASRARIVVNDRPDVARLAAAGGVHVGQDDLPPADARAIVGPGMWVGVSTHTLDQARAALDQPVDYVAVGPVYATATKDTGYEAVGLRLIGAVAAAAAGRQLPIVAIGGITLERAPEVLAAGASAVCVISDLLNGDPGERARAFLAVI
jgi:thiamine-phosphate pyrophosphorylase